MKKFDGYLLVSDIDGTLAEERYIPQPNVSALAEFTSQGGQVLLATGRSPQSSVPVAKKLGCSAMLIANNGAMVYDMSSQRVVMEYTVDCRQVTEKVLCKFPQIGAMFYCGWDLWLAKDNFEMSQLIESEQLTLSESCTGPVSKVIFAGRADELDAVEDYMRSLTDLDGDVSRSGPNFVEILPKGVNKGSTMMALAEKMGIRPQRILAAGNYYNDVDMLSRAAITCVPDDSPDDIKATADFVACPCRQGAIAQFIEWLKTKI